MRRNGGCPNRLRREVTLIGLRGSGSIITLKPESDRTATHGSKRALVSRSNSSNSCWKTGAIRGLLCHACNTGLGSLGDTIDAVERALNYLRQPKSGMPRYRVYRDAILREQIRLLKAEQGGGCAGDFALDHDDVTGIARGLLCHRCNVGIGSLRDSPDLLERAVQYLRGSLTDAQRC